jgi:hypothetical protein
MRNAGAGDQYRSDWLPQQAACLWSSVTLRQKSPSFNQPFTIIVLLSVSDRVMCL